MCWLAPWRPGAASSVGNVQLRSPIRDIVGAADEPVAGKPLAGPDDSPAMRDIPTRRRRTKQAAPSTVFTLPI